MGNILMTSGFCFEGYHIMEYLGVFSGECALGTGFLSSLGAGFADFFGYKSTMYSEKLRKAKEYAVNQLITQIENVGGNAIIGLDINYTTFSADIMGVIANGTAVKIVKGDSISLEKDINITVRTTNRGLPFRAARLVLKNIKDTHFLSLDIYCQQECNLNGVMADIKFTTIFNEEYAIEDFLFMEFASNSGRHLISSVSQCSLPNNIVRTIKNASVIIKKYIENESVVELPEESINYDLMGNIEEEMAQDGFSLDDFIFSLEELKGAIEISKYIKEYNEEHNNIFDALLIEEVDKIAYVERIYGNKKESCIQKVREMLEEKK